MAYFFGDVLLATLTFSDVSASKRRPVLLLIDTGDADLLVIPIKSHRSRSKEDFELADWQSAGLRLPSTARMAKLATVAKTTVIRNLGRLSKRDHQEARDALDRFFRRIGEPVA